MRKAGAREEQNIVDGIKILDKTRTLEHHRTSPGGILDSSAKRVLQLRYGAQEGRFARAGGGLKAQTRRRAKVEAEGLTQRLVAISNQEVPGA